MLNKFFEFYLERLLENKSGTKLPLYYTVKFKDILKRIDNDISRQLLSIENSDNDDYHFTRTYIDIDPKSIDKISFIMVNKIKDIIRNKYPNSNSTDFRKDYLLDEYVDEIYNARQRSTMKINRFINEVTKNQYITKNLTEEEKKYNREQGILTNAQKLEIFVNKYKSFRQPGKFELVKENDIVYWYYGGNYSDGDGHLNNSCMKYSSCSGYIDFYVKNGNKISLLIMKDRDNDTKIIGRALVWKLDKPEGRIFMDRIYTNDQSDVEMFIEYATKQEWLYKYRQNMDSDEYIVDPKTGEKSKAVLYINEVVDSKDGEYPYLDTIKYYDREADILTNNVEILDNEYITLEGTHGEYVGGGSELSYEELIERYIDDILYDFDYYAKDIMMGFVWDYVDDDAFTQRYIDDYTDSELSDFEYIWDEDDMIKYIKEFVKDEDIPENLDEIDKSELFELTDDLDIRYDMTEWRLNDRYKGETAKSILEELYGSSEVEDMPEHIWNSISYYIDERACAEAYAEGEDEYYLRDRYDEN